MITPRTPSGTLELLPREQMIFQYMQDVIRRGYERFGFVPIETPVFEMKEVLLTKSGGETEKQVYFVQSTGGLQQGYDPEMALRFDLTVPLARYVAQHERELAFPFRRYQMQRVYRGERAQRGRSREFYQCDIDIIGKDKLSPAYDAELPAIIVQIFEELKVGDFTIHFSNRKILSGIVKYYTETKNIPCPDASVILREIDKLDKIGIEKVRGSLQEKGVPDIIAAQLMDMVTFEGGNHGTLQKLRESGIDHPLFLEGLLELEQVVAGLQALDVPEKRTHVNLAITRGLDYYTGTVYETFIDAHPEFGSICSGGRYEDLASHYTKSKLPGVGISIGLTRLFELLQEYHLLPNAPPTVQIMIAQLDPQLSAAYLALATELRAAGFRVENWLEPAKLDKQIKYADKCAVPIVLLVGGDEQANDTVIVKDMLAKTQMPVKRGDLVAFVRNILV